MVLSNIFPRRNYDGPSGKIETIVVLALSIISGETTSVIKKVPGGRLWIGTTRALLTGKELPERFYIFIGHKFPYAFPVIIAPSVRVKFPTAIGW